MFIISYLVFGPAGPAGILVGLFLFAAINDDCREMISNEWRRIKSEEHKEEK